MAAQPGPRQTYPQTNYLPNGATTGPSAGIPASGARPLDPNQGRVIQSGQTRILCVADVRGDINSLNTLAKQANATCVIHTGDFGFYDDSSLDRIADKTFKHVCSYSPFLRAEERDRIRSLPANQPVRSALPNGPPRLSQLPEFIRGQLKLDIPVYAVWGACEDVLVLEKLRSQEYQIPNLHILDEANSRLLEFAGIKLRLLGLGGALVMHKLFDNGEGKTTIAGGQGTMWTTILQIGELVDTANRTYDPSETRVLVTHASPSREGLLYQLAVNLKADFTLSGGLHFRYGSSYNEFSVNPSPDHFRGKMAASKASFQDVWETVKGEVQPMVAENEAHQRLLNNALEVVESMPSVANAGTPFGGSVDDATFKNIWNFNLADSAYGYLVLNIHDGRIGTEMHALGFNFSHRQQKADRQMQAVGMPPVPTPTAPTTSFAPPPPTQSQASAPSVGGLPVQQTRPGQQPRSTQQPAPAPQQQTQQTPTKAPTPSARPTPQAPAAQRPAPAQAANGAPATSEPKSNGVLSPAPAAEAATTVTPPPQRQEPREPSSGIFVQNGPKTEEEVKKLFPEQQQKKITGIEAIGSRGTMWHVKFASPKDMSDVLYTMPQEMKGKIVEGKPNIRPFHAQKPGQSRGPNTGTLGYKSGSDIEGGRGGRGGRGGFGRGGRGEGSMRGRGGRGGRGGAREVSTSTPAPAAAAAPSAPAS